MKNLHTLAFIFLVGRAIFVIPAMICYWLINAVRGQKAVDNINAQIRTKNAEANASLARAAVMRQEADRLNAHTAAILAAGHKVCPFCAEQIKLRAIACPHCQHDVPPATPEQEANLAAAIAASEEPPPLPVVVTPTVAITKPKTKLTGCGVALLVGIGVLILCAALKSGIDKAATLPAAAAQTVTPVAQSTTPTPAPTPKKKPTKK